MPKVLTYSAYRPWMVSVYVPSLSDIVCPGASKEDLENSK